LNEFFKKHGSISDNWNVLLLAGNNVPPYVNIDETCIRVSHCQTTTAYIIKQSYYDILLKNIRDGINKLMKNPLKPVLYAIDKYWIQLQKIHTWYMIVPVEAVQREDYSDIENKKTNYENMMKDIDKPAFVAQILVKHYHHLINRPLVHQINSILVTHLTLFLLNQHNIEILCVFLIIIY
jgi:hypothetical protein